MGDMKDKMKGFMKKVTSSSSGKFKGQGRVLGSSPSAPVNPIITPPNQSQSQSQIHRSNPPSSSSSSKPLPQQLMNSDNNNPVSVNYPCPPRKPTNGFDPYESLITSSKISRNGYSLNVVECPICGASFGSEEEVSRHVETCIYNSEAEDESVDGALGLTVNGVDSRAELEACVGSFLSGKPSEGSVDVVLRLFRNIVKEPDNAKFRKIRMSNPRIREAIGEVSGGVELLEIVGFELKEEGGEMWAVMETPKEEEIGLISKVIALLEPKNLEEPKNMGNPLSSASAEGNKEEALEPKKVDRQIRVFFSVPESVAAKIELPDSFYNLSLDEVKREADLRKKKIAESQLLIPKSYKEKQAKAARKRYARTVIRIQFPDGVVLQAFFSPQETTTALYEFVGSALKESSLQFELLDPVLVRRRVIPHFPTTGQKPTTLEEEGLVPSALIKFRPIETDSVVFMGLSNELLEISEPLVTDSAVPPA
ncbi:hypothetical protein SLE2022_143170 [Rubroshorea leprosula]